MAIPSFSLYEYLKNSPRHQYHLADNVREMYVKKGEYIYRPSEDIYTMYEIIKGVVKIGSYSKDGSEIVYEVLKPGDFFGNMHYLDGNFQEFSKAASCLHLRQYDLVFYKYLIENEPQPSEWFNKYVVRRWCRAETRFFTVVAEDILTRIQRLYKEFNKDVMDAKGNMVNVFSLLSQKEIGDLTGSTRQTIAQVFRQIKKCPELIYASNDHVKLV